MNPYIADRPPLDVAAIAAYTAGVRASRGAYYDHVSPRCVNGHRKAVGTVCSPCAAAKSKRARERAK